MSSQSSAPARQITRLINAALEDADERKKLLSLPPRHAAAALDEIWRHVESVIPEAAIQPRHDLRRLALKLSLKSNALPAAFYLQGVKATESDSRGTGGHADVYYGTFEGRPVAVKRLRPYQNWSEKEKEKNKKWFHRESLLWKGLSHDYILPFLGVSNDAFHGIFGEGSMSMCMVLPWMSNGTLREYVATLRKQGKLSGDQYVTAVDEWLYQISLGMEYLHNEDIVHGDFHGGNILVDDSGSIRLTDFGRSLISRATPGMNASVHNGGALRWTAPELFNPEEFGFESSRPTRASDVYSFACACVEMYAGKAPFADLQDAQVGIRVLRGGRPPRPSLPDGGEMSDEMWTLTTSCWEQDPSARPPFEDIAGSLREITQSHKVFPPSPTPPTAYSRAINSSEVQESTSSTKRIVRLVWAALQDEQEQSKLLSLPKRYAASALDVIWELLENPPGSDAQTGVAPEVLPQKLRRLALKLTLKHDMLPTAFFLKGVERTEKDSRGAGAFADVYYGSFEGRPVAIKRLRAFGNMPESEKVKRKQWLYRESLLWKGLSHGHILPFLGVSNDAFSNDTICMVLPWMPNGTLQQYMDTLQTQGKLSGDQFAATIDEWLYQISLGLECLHGEGVVHGDLHGGNILVDADGGIRLTDFGMALISEATAGNYASIHGGGAFRFKAPEVMDPESFGLESNRPTYASDVYSFACICVEIYTRKAPFADLSDGLVAVRVLNGERPPRPSLPNGAIMSEAMWSLTTSCWVENPTDRLLSKAIADSLWEITQSHKGLPPPQMPPTVHSRAGDGEEDHSDIDEDAYYTLLDSYTNSYGTTRPSASVNLERPQEISAVPSYPLHRTGGPLQSLNQLAQGKRKAVCIGINSMQVYPGGKFVDRISEAKNVYSFLNKHCHYKEEDIKLLTDESPDPSQYPTSVNIQEAIAWLVRGARAGDHLFFHFSGEAVNGELSHMEPGIAPMYYWQSYSILQSSLRAALIAPLPASCQLTILLDACDATMPRSARLDLVTYMAVVDTSQRIMISDVTLNPQNPGGPPMLSAAASSQIESSMVCVWGRDWGFSTGGSGSMSSAFISSYINNPHQTWQELLRSTTATLRMECGDDSTFCCSHALDETKPFKIEI